MNKLFVISSLLWQLNAQVTLSNLGTPDCAFEVELGNFPSFAYDNRTRLCQLWVITGSSLTNVNATFRIQSAPAAAGAWTDAAFPYFVAGTDTGGATGLTVTNGNQVQRHTTALNSWIRLNPQSFSGFGTVKLVVWGFKLPTITYDGTNGWTFTTGGGGGGGGGGTVSFVYYDAGNCNSALTLNPANGSAQLVTLTGDCVLTLTQPSAGQYVTMRIKVLQTGTFTNSIFSSKWPGGVPYVQTGGNGAYDWVACMLDGTNVDCTAAQSFQ